MSLPASQPGRAVPPPVAPSRNVSPRPSAAPLRRKVAPELSELIVYCKAGHFEGFDEGDPEPAYDRVVSVSESTSNQLLRQRPRQYAWYNAVQMTRVYPSFSRVTSTNYSPLSHWAAGCQLVALNFQTHDRHMQVYEAMFARTRAAGYVPKPRSLCEPGACELSPPLSTASTASLASALAARRSTVHISVIAAYNVTRAPARRAAHTRRASAASEAGAERRRGSFAHDPSLSPQLLSRPPSDVAMFAAGDAAPDHSVMSAAAAVAAAANAVASLASTQQPSAGHLPGDLQLPAGAASRIRVEIEWIADGAGSSGASSSSEDLTALASSVTGGQFGPSALHSRGNTTLNSPAVQLPAAFPFNLGSLATPLGNSYNPPPTAVAPVPAEQLPPPSGKPRYLTKTGVAQGNEVRWRDESLFHVISDMDLGFARFALLDDDVELASACVSLCALKEGYRFLELGENERYFFVSTVYVIVSFTGTVSDGS
ncbi:phospholipase [Coemansia sp. RSA 2611]|nr:phospholipase [Coemansia sp. RSA 2611]